MQPLHNPYFVKFIVYFNENQDFFECHEVLEEYWKSLPNGTKDHLLTGYILIATGMYHWRRGNNVGALKSLRNASRKLRTSNDASFQNGIDFAELSNNVKKAILALEKAQSFTPFTISVTSSELQLRVDAMKPKLDLLPFDSDAVIHKHMLRDRSDILRKREEKKKGGKS